jgi:hypothetical protein
VVEDESECFHDEVPLFLVDCDLKKHDLPKEDNTQYQHHSQWTAVISAVIRIGVCLLMSEIRWKE